MGKRIHALIGCILWLAAGALAADAPPMRYTFKAGETYTYDVKIEAETMDATEIVSGFSIYKVKRVDAKSGQMTLTHSGTLLSQRQFKPRPRGVAPQIAELPAAIVRYTDYNEAKELVIDPRGGVLRYQTKPQLPYLLASAWGLLIEPLPEKAQDSWQMNRDMEITTHQVIRIFMPRREERPNVTRVASEVIDYSIVSQNADVLTIERRYLLATAEQVDGEPALEQKGTGTIEFDSKAGVIRSLSSKLVTRANEPGITLRAGISVSAKLLTAEDLAKLEEKRKEDAAKLAQKRKEVMEKNRSDLAKTNPDLFIAQEELDKALKRGASPEEMNRLMIEVEKAAQAGPVASRNKAVDDAGVDAALAKLKQADRSKVIEGAKTFALSPPIEKRRAEVSKALQKLLSEQDFFVRTEALKALRQWVTAENVPTLIALLDDQEHFVQTGAIEVLGAIKDERGAAAVAGQLPDFGVQRQARLALVTIGPVAEKYVLPLLKHKDWGVRREVCQILAEIGTSKSIEPLKEATKDRELIVQQIAQDALRAVEGRQK
jgi:hypothetical protein